MGMITRGSSYIEGVDFKKDLRPFHGMPNQIRKIQAPFNILLNKIKYCWLESVRKSEIYNRFIKATDNLFNFYDWKLFSSIGEKIFTLLKKLEAWIVALLKGSSSSKELEKKVSEELEEMEFLRGLDRDAFKVYLKGLETLTWDYDREADGLTLLQRMEGLFGEIYGMCAVNNLCLPTTNERMRQRIIEWVEQHHPELSKELNVYTPEE